ncbi:MAG: hypothetical protein V7707_06325 [Motiliproteus sp.]
MNDTWNEVSQKEINRPKSSSKQGVKVKILISPLDVPSASRIDVGDDASEFIIEFKYLSGTEPKLTIPHEDGVTFSIGKNSGKIYKVTLTKSHFRTSDSYKIDLSEVLRVAKSEISEYGQTPRRRMPVRIGNIAAIQNVLNGQMTQPNYSFC